MIEFLVSIGTGVLIFLIGVKVGYVIAMYRVLRDLHDG